MKRKVILRSLVLCLLLAILTSSSDTVLAHRLSPNPPTLPDTDFTEHENAGGVTRILVSGHTEIILIADHTDSCEFGRANRIQISVSANPTGVGTPFKPVASFEDNPKREAFSESLGTPTLQNLVKPGQIQVFRIGKIVSVIWTIPLVVPATAASPPTIPGTPEVVLPPGMLIFLGKGNPYYMEATGTFPAGWAFKFETWQRYDANVYFYCRGWNYYGLLTEAPSPYMITDRTVTWTAP